MKNIEKNKAKAEYVFAKYDLTSTEKDICEWLVAGASRTSIRKVLDMNDNTLRFHLKNIYRKILTENHPQRDKLHALTVQLLKDKGIL